MSFWFCIKLHSEFVWYIYTKLKPKCKSDLWIFFLHSSSKNSLFFQNPIVCSLYSCVFWVEMVALLHVRNDDVVFAENLTNCSSSIRHDEDDESYSGMTKAARDFLKKKFGSISRFYSGIVSADSTNVNGFSRIVNLRKALAALDRGGWERSYHQRIFHVCILHSVLQSVTTLYKHKHLLISLLDFQDFRSSSSLSFPMKIILLDLAKIILLALRNIKIINLHAIIWNVW